MVESVVNNAWIYAKESGRGLILSIVTKFAAFAGESHYSNVSVVPPSVSYSNQASPTYESKASLLEVSC